MAYLLKERVGEPEQLVAAVSTVAEGGSVIDSEVVATLVEQRALRDDAPSLTARELDVLGQMAQDARHPTDARRRPLSGWLSRRPRCRRRRSRSRRPRSPR